MTDTMFVKGGVLCAAIGVAVAVSAGGANAWTIKVLHDFCPKGGCSRSFSNAGLVMDTDGNLYGTRENDGKHLSGTIFKLSFNVATQDWDYTVLHDFCSRVQCADGSTPHATSILDSAGNLYGTTVSGGSTQKGVLYELTAAGKYRVLYSFCPSGSECPDGETPEGITYAGADAGQPYDGVSPIYGAALTESTGVLFEARHANKKLKVAAIYTFPNEFGGGCYAEAVAMNAAGNLYGVTEYCGDDNAGEAFVLAPSDAGWTKVAHYSFQSGFQARGQLLADAAGDLFGVTNFGGKFNGGIAYQLAPLVDTYRIKTLHQFSFPSGNWPMAGLVRGASNDFFGTVEGGGPGPGGGVFEISGKNYQLIYGFCPGKDCSNGSVPVAGVTADKNGNLFGVTTQGGAHGNGTVFELIP